MANAAIVGTALTDQSAHPFSLLVGGVDVIKEPGGSGFGVPVESVRVSEAGPGGVSSIEFQIDDPFKEVTIPDGSEVVFWKGDSCLFRGWVDQMNAQPDFGGIGRTWSVQGIGIEAILDWTICKAMTAPFDTSNPRFPWVVSFLCSLFAPQLKAPMSGPTGDPPAPYTNNGSFDYPIGSMLPVFHPITSPSLPTITGTLRQAIEAYAQQCYRQTNPPTGVPFLATVDFYWGMRVWEDAITNQPDDYTTLTITDTYAGANVADTLRYENEPGSDYHGAYVEGTGIAGFYGDGSGIYGRTGLIQDTAITDDASARERVATFIAQQAIPARGSFQLNDWTPPTTVHAGSLVSITDAATGIAQNFRIMQIDKTWNNSGRENWTISFGGLQRSAMRRMRNLTRTTRTYGVTGAA